MICSWYQSSLNVRYWHEHTRQLHVMANLKQDHWESGIKLPILGGNQPVYISSAHKKTPRKPSCAAFNRFILMR